MNAATVQHFKTLKNKYQSYIQYMNLLTKHEYMIWTIVIVPKNAIVQTSIRIKYAVSSK